ncbi:ferritin-like domain-containing protein [Dokdonella ginsengisoli]|uniref:Ferritin-like domain-containing protein n=1 Tax=Dokdonella ginsengisoli TaxID=363846 RepID=A0ABV9QXV1_9GAMM
MSYAQPLPWTLENIGFDRIEIERIRPNEDLFFLLTSSSFVESGSDLYTRNLIDHFDGDAELQGWLADHWEQEELQHGRALAAYVRRVWPEFDWDGGFKAFWDEYGAVCTAAQLEDSRGLELAARCVVETGTASLYRALNAIAEEPVLRALTDQIRKDEVRHYKHFYQHFTRYRERESIGRFRVFRTVLKRVLEIRDEDSDIALRHVFVARYPERAADKAECDRVTSRARDLLRRHIPADMTVKMLLKPLDLPARLLRTLETPLARLTERLFLN